MIKQILVATDDSEPAKKAVSYAIDLAGKLQATIVAINVVDVPSIIEMQSIPGEVSPTHLIEPFEDYMNQVGTTIMGRIEASCREKGIRFKGLVKTGHPIEKIITTAQEIGADLIILGSRGRGALGSVLLGSVTLGVIHREIRIPVLIVK
jgi:nucleotide-binding universal stress UspA family protein